MGIEDIIKPLATKCRKSNLNIDKLFKTYDKDGNMRLSPDELRDALFKECKIKMIGDEVKVIKDYFFNKFKSN